MAQFDWDHLRTFIALARCGRLTVAASQAGSDHTTISRRITALEHALQAKLFERSPSGYALTPDGLRLLPMAEQMESLAIQAVDAVGGATQAIKGSVRIAGPEGFGSYFLAPRLSLLGNAHPGLHIQLLASPSLYSLTKRDADIVITLSRPSEGRLVARKLTDYDLGLYAARSYLDQSKPIQRKADLEGHKFVGYVGDLVHIPELDYLHQVSATAVASLESSNLLVQVKATASGAGLCVLPAFIAKPEPELISVLPEEIHLTRSFWLLVHADHRDRVRVKVASRFIIDQVAQCKALFRLGVAEALNLRDVAPARSEGCRRSNGDSPASPPAVTNVH